MKYLSITNRCSLIVIDDEDYDRLSQYKWAQNKTETSLNGVIRRTLPKSCRSISIANDVMRRYDVMFDHIDHNPRNNQKSNLRECTLQQNTFNKSKRTGTSSQYIGVSWDRKRGRWLSTIRINGRNIFLGRFTDEILAAKAYDTKAVSLFKEFANLNFK